MKIGLVGRKVGMTQVYSDTGEKIAVTVLKAGPCRVVSTREQGRDGYDAVQLGFEAVMKKRGLNRPLAGYFKKAEVEPCKILREVRGMPPNAFEVGQEIAADLFRIGDRVDVQGFSRGRGFAGGVKRHGWRGGKATHGSMFHRAPGSIGCSSYPSRVFKGKTLPGRMGNSRVTTKNLQVVGVDTETGVILVRGAVPGSPRGLVLITARRAPATGVE